MNTKANAAALCEEPTIEFLRSDEFISLSPELLAVVSGGEGMVSFG